MDLFVYGTLLSPKLMAAVAGPGPLKSKPAILQNYAIYPVAGNVVPFITSEDSAVTNGLIWQELTGDQLARLDAYEGAFGYQLTPLDVVVDGNPTRCHCYLPPDGLKAGQGGWSLQAWEADHLAPALLAAAELFSHRPLPDHGTLRRMWPMIENRAWAKHRANLAPARLRHDAKPDDFSIVAQHPPLGSFYRLQSIDVTHQRFDGQRSHVLVREAFFGVDAAIVLPYDRVTDRILLVEQARMGPAARRDPNPWMLEPIAGIVDARETPEAAALREAKEEAGLDLRHLEPAGRYYPSPGSSTDYFYCYVGLCDLPDGASYLGGLEDEAEDLRLHPLPFDDAIALADTGEIATGPTLHLLYWLAFHRDRLRTADI